MTWMSKRKKFIFTSFFLSIGLLLISVAEISWRYLAIGILTFLTAGLTIWSLREALSGIRWLTTIILPAFFTAAIGLFYFLLPTTWLSRLPIVILYAFGMYALLLTENIFSVAAIRTIQLFRAAFAVGFLLTLLTAFLLFDTIFSFRLFAWGNFVLVYLVSLPLFFQGLWSVNLEEKVNRSLLTYSFFLPLVLSQIAWFISFFPLTIAMSSLFLTAGMYLALGLTQAYFQERLFRQTIYEYLGVGVAVLVIMLATARWGG